MSEMTCGQTQSHQTSEERIVSLSILQQIEEETPVRSQYGPAPPPHHTRAHSQSRQQLAS